MNKLIRFLLTYGIYVYFAVLELIALLLVFNNNQLQRSAFFSASNEIAGKVYEIDEVITDYLDLREINKNLSEENIRLRNRLFFLENKYQSYTHEFSNLRNNPELEYECRSAKVINNSTDKLQNYIMLNRGSEDGISNDMSVINGEGVVGFVKSVSSHFALVMPILNSKAQISCKIKTKDIQTRDTIAIGRIKDIGSVVWYGGDCRFAKMEKVPRHVAVKVGDEIVTSGYSDFFPEGLLVGTVESFTKAENDSYYDITVRLAVNFKVLSYVEVLDYKNMQEQRELAKEVENEKK